MESEEAESRVARDEQARLRHAEESLTEERTRIIHLETFANTRVNALVHEVEMATAAGARLEEAVQDGGTTERATEAKVALMVSELEAAQARERHHAATLVTF